MKAKSEYPEVKERLQEVTDLDGLSTIKKLIRKADLTEKEIDFLKKYDQEKLNHEIEKYFQELPQEKRLQFLNHVWDVSEEYMRRQTYEYNHIKIMETIRNCIVKNKYSPPVNEIADKTNLSRKTVYKHLQDFDTSKYYELERRKQKMMCETLKEKLCYMAHTGDTKAAKLYLQLTGQIQQTTTNVNVLHINNTFIDVKILQALPEESRAVIESTIQKELLKSRPSD